MRLASIHPQHLLACCGLGISGQKAGWFMPKLRSFIMQLREVLTFHRDARRLHQFIHHTPHPRAVPVGPCLSEDQVAEYVIGVMSARDSEAAKRHLETCPACATEVRDADFFVWQSEHGPRLYA